MMSGPNWQRRGMGPTEWNFGSTQTYAEDAKCPPFRGRWHAHLKPVISEKKWSGAQRWVEGRITAQE